MRRILQRLSRWWTGGEPWEEYPGATKEELATLSPGKLPSTRGAVDRVLWWVFWVMALLTLTGTILAYRHTGSPYAFLLLLMPGVLLAVLLCAPKDTE